jgi:hypothetical protein
MMFKGTTQYLYCCKYIVAILCRWEGNKKQLNEEINLHGDVKKIVVISLEDENNKTLDK